MQRLLLKTISRDKNIFWKRVAWGQREGKPPEMIISYTWLEIGIFKLQQMSHCKPSCCEVQHLINKTQGTMSQTSTRSKVRTPNSATKFSPKCLIQVSKHVTGTGNLTSAHTHNDLKHPCCSTNSWWVWLLICRKRKKWWKMHPGSLTARPWKMVGKEDDPASYWVSVTFQGRAVKLREGSASNTNGGVNMKFIRDLL